MKPLNESERRRAFLNFLLFFAITVIVVAIAVMSSTRVPLKENENLRNQLMMVDQEKKYLLEFEKKMLEATRLLDSFEMARNEYLANEEIKKNFSGMTAIMNDSMSVNSICSRIFENLNSLHIAKQQLRAVSNSKAELEEKNREIEKLQSKVDELNNTVIRLLAGR